MTLSYDGYNKLLHFGGLSLQRKQKMVPVVVSQLLTTGKSPCDIFDANEASL